MINSGEKNPKPTSVVVVFFIIITQMTNVQLPPFNLGQGCRSFCHEKRPGWISKHYKQLFGRAVSHKSRSWKREGNGIAAENL